MTGDRAVIAKSTHALVRRAGYPARLIDGDPENRKITFPGDLERGNPADS
ncbi:MAG: hypothetical protein MI741_06590 [Rhodospirillales bacterium]|nr:hypothetical protein [Rhodospirillales bacterium]